VNRPSANPDLLSTPVRRPVVWRHRAPAGDGETQRCKLLRVHDQASAAWQEFSIGPASGESVNITKAMLRSDGITLKAALAAAYGMPAAEALAALRFAE